MIFQDSKVPVKFKFPFYKIVVILTALLVLRIFFMAGYWLGVEQTEIGIDITAAK